MPMADPWGLHVQVLRRQVQCHQEAMCQQTARPQQVKRQVGPLTLPLHKCFTLPKIVTCRSVTDEDCQRTSAETHHAPLNTTVVKIARVLIAAAVRCLLNPSPKSVSGNHIISGQRDVQWVVAGSSNSPDTGGSILGSTPATSRTHSTAAAGTKAASAGKGAAAEGAASTPMTISDSGDVVPGSTAKQVRIVLGLCCKGS